MSLPTTLSTTMAGLNRRQGLVLGLAGLGGLAGLALVGGTVAARSNAEPASSVSANAASAPPDDVCRVAPLQAWTPAMGPDRLAARTIPADARCPVCGMYPARAPGWACQLIYRDGAAHYVDAALDLLRYLQQPGRHAPGYTLTDVARIYLPDAASTRPAWLDASSAWLVVGSRLEGAQAGPMRHGALPAFASDAAARRWQADHGGEVWAWSRLLSEPLTAWPASLRTLLPGSAHAHR